MNIPIWTDVVEETGYEGDGTLITCKPGFEIAGEKFGKAMVRLNNKDQWRWINIKYVKEN